MGSHDPDGDGARTRADAVTDRGRGVVAPLVRARGLRLFAAPRDQPRTRRATDVLLLAPAVLALVVAVAVYPPSVFERALIAFLASVPRWLDPVWAFLADLVWLWAIVLVVAALVRTRLVVVAQAGAAVVAAVAVGALAARTATGTWPDVGDAVLGTSGAPPFPSVRVAAATAVILTLAPHLARPMRRLGRWLVLLGVVGAAVVGGATPLGTISGVLVAVIAAAAVRLAWGTSAGRPGLDDVAAGLAELGVRADELVPLEHQPAGVFHVRAVADDGRRLLVKVYGRDAYDTQLVAKLWRTVWYRGDGPPVGLGRLQLAEHEAFVTLLAEKGGLPTHEVVTAGATVHDDALLVLRDDATPLVALARDEIDGDLLRGAWRAVVRLGELRLAHQQIDPTTVALVGGDVGLVELGAATVAPDPHQLGTDRAQLLMTTASLVGAERALTAAVEALGREGLAELLPYLQAAAFSPTLRRALKEADLDVDDFRKQAAETLGVEPPGLVRLRRVTPRSVVQLGLLGLASYTIITAAADVDWDEVGSTLSHASWGWLAAGFVVAQLPRLTQALSTLGSVPAPLPFGPVYAMQLATSYMNVALPSNLARMAINIRFFQRQGLSAPTAVASGTIDSFASTVIQALLLALLLVFSESSLALDVPLPSLDARLLWVLAALVAGSLAALVLVGRIRRTIVDQVRRWWPDVKATLSGLRASSKLALLVLGSLATEVLFAIALGLFANGLGYDLTLAELLVINISVSLLASFVPVPGGVGVAEFGLTVGLTAAGMTAEAALAAVLLYRVSTFYLPPLWGFPALQWLQRNRYL